MPQPIATAENIAFAFPDLCLTPAPPAAPVPIPYPNIAQLSAASPTSVDHNVFAGGRPVLLANSEVQTSSGDEAGTAGGVVSGRNMGPCTMATFSGTVNIGGQGVVRFGDTTMQNDGNCTGTVLSALPTVLVGG